MSMMVSLVSAKQMNRIINGKNATQGQFPYQVSWGFDYFESFEYIKLRVNFCGGSIIDKTTIITAAHCCESIQGLSPIFPHLGNFGEFQNFQFPIPRGILIGELGKNGKNKNPNFKNRLSKNRVFFINWTRFQSNSYQHTVSISFNPLFFYFSWGIQKQKSCDFKKQGQLLLAYKTLQILKKMALVNMSTRILPKH